jgi:glycosyltransferase involved in cell wall biosynthesis
MAAEQPLHIALVSARYYPYMGGTETHVHEVSRRLSAAGHAVTILTSDVSGKLPAEECRDGVQIRRFQAYPRGTDLYFAPQIYQAVAGGDWDVVHEQGYHTFVAPIAMSAARHAKIPYVVTFHSGGHSSGLRNAIRRFQYEMLRPLLRDAAQLIGVSEFEANLFSEKLRLPRERFKVIPNGSQLPQVTGTPVGTSEKRLILSVGRLERYKGHHRVIRAMPTVLETFPDAYLRIAGSGPYEAELRELVHQLQLDPYVGIAAIPPGERNAMAELMARAALVTLISDYEAHPVAVMEAVGLKRPVLVAHTSGLAELADRGLVASIPLKTDDVQLGKAIIEQLQNPFQVNAEIEFPTWEGCTEQLMQVYADVTGIHQ